MPIVKSRRSRRSRSRSRSIVKKSKKSKSKKSIRRGGCWLGDALWGTTTPPTNINKNVQMLLENAKKAQRNLNVGKEGLKENVKRVTNASSRLRLR